MSCALYEDETANAAAPPRSLCVDADGRRCTMNNAGEWSTDRSSGRQPCSCLISGCPNALRSNGVCGRSHPAPTAAPEGSKCWAVLGVLTVFSTSGAKLRRHIRESYLRFGNAGRSVCVRFVLGAPSASVAADTRGRVQHERATHADLVMVEAHDENCAAKSFAWFQHAGRAYGGAAWIGKADSDTFIQLESLEADLRSLGAVRHAVVGQFQWAATWLPAAATGAGKP